MKKMSVKQEVRVSLGLSQLRMAQFYNMERGRYSMIEHGHRAFNHDPSLLRFANLALLLKEQPVQLPAPVELTDEKLKALTDMVALGRKSLILLERQQEKAVRTKEARSRLTFLLQNLDRLTSPDFPTDTTWKKMVQSDLDEAPNPQQEWEEELKRLAEIAALRARLEFLESQLPTEKK